MNANKYDNHYQESGDAWILTGGTGNPLISITFYYWIEELNFYFPGVPGCSIAIFEANI
jgi:hypothetical protein